MDSVACHQKTVTGITFFTGRATKQREIDAVDRVQVVGKPKCRGLIGLHNFSGADWGGKFVEISKRAWISAYLKLPEDDPAVKNFSSLDHDTIPSELDNDALPQPVDALETFLCIMYCGNVQQFYQH